MSDVIIKFLGSSFHQKCLLIWYFSFEKGGNSDSFSSQQTSGTEHLQMQRGRKKKEKILSTFIFKSHYLCCYWAWYIARWLDFLNITQITIFVFFFISCTSNFEGELFYKISEQFNKKQTLKNNWVIIIKRKQLKFHCYFLQWYWWLIKVIAATDNKESFIKEIMVRSDVFIQKNISLHRMKI